jgi:serine phosphatase RsbU (regulator of sigma subunit)
MKTSRNDKDELIKLLQKQQKELEQSLQYASYIQQALFPKDSVLKHFFPESFLLFMPRDIVSGDFYWVHRENDKIILAVGDSTGHGVPGAFLSILGISFLNLVISKYKPTSAAFVLNNLREYLMKALDQTGKDREQKDGIDMALCIIDIKTKVLQFAGAFNPVYIVRNKEIFPMEGDKMPIGVAAEFEESFKNTVFNLQSDDILYLFTDGFPDQFGGPDQKKYKYKKFRQLLILCSTLPILEQADLLKNEFLNWKGELHQLDDLTILGIKF